jgi:prepilin-type N-terminal cleavage/methylation domain-containing protein
MKRNPSAAFTLIEMLVVISIIAVLAAFAVPALTSALARGQMTGTLNNTRQFYLAAQQMALDGATNSDANLTWPGDAPDAATLTLETYCERLVQNDYLKIGDVQKLLSAPGAVCTVTPPDSSTTPPTGMKLGGKSALKVYKVKDSDSSNTILAVTSNYVYDTALTSTDSPFGDKGFIVQRKGGDANILRKNQAVATAGNPTAFQSSVGKKPGEADGTVTAGDPTGVMKYP